jgi:hypothetical protein
MNETDRENFIPAGFGQMLSNFLMATDQITDAVLGVAAVREPEKYADAVSLVKTGRLIPRIIIEPGRLQISLIDVANGADIGAIFSYNVPALGARGAAH